ncbi:hypothetical protein SYNPS1DRAFT_24041 [Syncephalis pseudoplumigaleata]|uniref:Histone deacetylase complex subunit SAP30 Sin3 binding domain-containing protein n=1 Tax=Syncephalis pseudoplumigaleata TaxID=1712513 RepID=A0A4P9YV44_9FUNG|nr:hypothetical protein SYNPS1DRAFT_24041 [Syncephalis pseudoplumigaleata]|eukprot:RKP23876.1 hypothetical protein SYNPS1DRAFT_24041 [Syncephalis pseudoplumigaleata]
MDDAYASGMNGAAGMAADAMVNGGYGASTGGGGMGGKQDPKSHANARLDFSTLPAPTLRRYQRVHKLHYGKVRGGHREDLASAVARHFNNQMVNEVESIAWFIYAVRSRDHELKLTQKPPS